MYEAHMYQWEGIRAIHYNNNFTLASQLVRMTPVFLYTVLRWSTGVFTRLQPNLIRVQAPPFLQIPC